MKVKPFTHRNNLKFIYRVTVHNTPEKVTRLYRHVTNFAFDYLYGDKAACIIKIKPHNVTEIKYGTDGLLTITEVEIVFNIINPIRAYWAIKYLIGMTNRTLEVQEESKAVVLERVRYRNHFIDNGGDFDSL